MIYFAVAGSVNAVKIGRSRNPHSRVIQLRSSCPVKVTLKASFDWPNKAEFFIHHAFSNSRKHGEWFELSHRAKQFLKFAAENREWDLVARFLFDSGWLDSTPFVKMSILRGGKVSPLKQ